MRSPTAPDSGPHRWPACAPTRVIRERTDVPEQGPGRGDHVPDATPHAAVLANPSAQPAGPTGNQRRPHHRPARSPHRVGGGAGAEPPRTANACARRHRRSLRAIRSARCASTRKRSPPTTRRSASCSRWPRWPIRPCPARDWRPRPTYEARVPGCRPPPRPAHASPLRRQRARACTAVHRQPAGHGGDGFGSRHRTGRHPRGGAAAVGVARADGRRRRVRRSANGMRALLHASRSPHPAPYQLRGRLFSRLSPPHAGRGSFCTHRVRRSGSGCRRRHRRRYRRRRNTVRCAPS